VIGSAIYGPRVVAIEGTTTTSIACAARCRQYAGRSSTVNIRRTTPRAPRPTASRSPNSSAELPKHVVVPTAGGHDPSEGREGVQGASRDRLVKDAMPAIYSAQAAGCAPVIHCAHRGADIITPVKPNTIAKSIAIGNPRPATTVLAPCARPVLGRSPDRRRDRRGDPAPRPHRRHLHRARRRYDRRRHQEAHRAGPHPA